MTRPGRLLELTVADLALIDRLELAFGEGLNVITGETGAGKSLLIDALGLALGARADSSLVRHGADSPGSRPGWSEPAGTCCASARSAPAADRAPRLDGEAVPAARLAEVAGPLVEIHGQHDQQQLLDEKPPARPARCLRGPGGAPAGRPRGGRGVARQRSRPGRAGPRAARAGPAARAGRARGGRDRGGPAAGRRSRRDQGPTRGGPARRGDRPRRGCDPRGAHRPGQGQAASGRPRRAGRRTPCRGRGRPASTAGSTAWPYASTGSMRKPRTSPPRPATWPSSSSTTRRSRPRARGAAVPDLRPGTPLWRR